MSNKTPKPVKLSRNARYIQKSYAAQDANRTARAARKALGEGGRK